jgi:hypothetical protein
MIDEHGNHLITDGEVWIYQDGTIRSINAVTDSVTDGRRIVEGMKTGAQVINLTTLEPV